MKMPKDLKKDGLEKRWATGAEDYTQQPPTKMPVSTARTLAKRRRVMPKTDDYYVTIRPNIETITDDAYFIMAEFMKNLAKKLSDGGKVDSSDVNMYYKFADMLVKMQREERMGLSHKAEEFDGMTEEALTALVLEGDWENDED